MSGGGNVTHDVFVSYSHHDKPRADAVCTTLEARGIRCWIAPRDIVPGQEWGAAIVEAIRAARVMVLVFSSHANASPQVRREVERAVTAETVLIPLRIENVAPVASLEYFLGTPHWLDALVPPFEAHLDGLATAVASFIDGGRRQPPAPPPPRPDPAPTAVPAAGGPEEVWMRTYAAPAARVWDALRSTIAGLDYKDVIENRAHGTITYRTGLSLWSWRGQQMIAFVQDNETSTVVTLKGVKAFTAATTWGEYDRLARKVLDGVEGWLSG